MHFLAQHRSRGLQWTQPIPFQLQFHKGAVLAALFKNYTTSSLLVLHPHPGFLKTLASIKKWICQCPEWIVHSLGEQHQSQRHKETGQTNKEGWLCSGHLELIIEGKILRKNIVGNPEHRLNNDSALQPLQSEVSSDPLQHRPQQEILPDHSINVL